MSYVYRKVAQDPDSHQTPHFGYLDGDGDFIFSAPILSELQESEEEGHDVLVAIPVPSTSNGELEFMNTIEKTKEFLSNSRYRIKLHDLIVENTRNTLTRLSDEEFPLQAKWSVDEFSDRLEKYEVTISELLSITALIGYWGKDEHKGLMCLPSKRLSSRLKAVSGPVIWSALRWYPILLLTYGIGLGAVAANNYENLNRYFQTKVTDPLGSRLEISLLQALYNSVGRFHDGFKSLPGRERQFAPVSEYLHKCFQPLLDDLLFLGDEYESVFDRLEIFIALEHALRKGAGYGDQLEDLVGKVAMVMKTAHYII